jgi:MFS transporter, PAT family, beta-lactamase induction signal transducer AmpG
MAPGGRSVGARPYPPRVTTSPPSGRLTPRRTAALVLLGFASGLPATLVDTLSAWATDAGLDKTAVARLSLLALPFALKFVWAPLLDRWRPPLLARRRLGWAVVAQALLVVTLLVLGATSPVAETAAFAAAGVALAFLSASQDIAIDGWRADLLTGADRGPGTSAFVGAWRLAMVVGGAGVIWLATRGGFGFAGAFRAMAVLMAAGIAASLLAPAPEREAPPAPTLRAAIVEPFRELLARPDGKLVLLFVLLFRIPDPLAGSVTVPFLKNAVGFEMADIGAVRGGIGVAAGIAGALAGGFVVRRLGIRNALWAVGALQAASNLGFWWLGRQGPDHGAFVAVAVTESVCNGLTAAGFLAYLISQCDPRHSGTQIALFTSLAVVAGRVAGAYAGEFVDALGWGGFFVASAAAGLPGMLCIPWLRIPDGDAVEPGGT